MSSGQFNLRSDRPRITAGVAVCGAVIGLLFYGAHVDTPVQASANPSTTVGSHSPGVGNGKHHHHPSPTPRHSPTPTPTHTPRPTPTPTVTPSPTPTGGVKPPLVGVLDRNGQPASQFDSVMGGWVVNVHWADVQPTSSTQLVTTTIDQAIAAVNALNAQNHTSMGLKLRFFAGQWAPAWVKSLDGAPFTITDPQGGVSGTVGRWWTTNFATAYNSVEGLLAARYDGNSALREVTVSRCTSIYAEPMIRQASSAADRATLLGAGYTVAADELCQEQAVAAGAVWQHTRSDLSFNPYQSVTASGMTIDETFTEYMMGYCKSTLGTRCGIENNSLSNTRAAGGYATMYAAMTAHAPGLTVQTSTMSRMTSLQVTLQDAVAMGCSSVELPSGYQTSPASMFQVIDSGLAANPST